MIGIEMSIFGLMEKPLIAPQVPKSCVPAYVIYFSPAVCGTGMEDVWL